MPVDTREGEQHVPAFRAISPNGNLPAIMDTDGPGGAAIAVFDSNAILLYLGDKTGRFVGTAADRGELLSWLMFVATGIGPIPARPCISSALRRSDCPMPSIATGARPSGTIACSTSTWRSATTSSATATRSSTWQPGLDRPRTHRAAWRARSARRLSEPAVLAPCGRCAAGRRAGARGWYRPCLQAGHG